VGGTEKPQYCSDILCGKDNRVAVVDETRENLESQRLYKEAKVV